jgi:hypothetical protein
MAKLAKCALQGSTALQQQLFVQNVLSENICQTRLQVKKSTIASMTVYFVVPENTAALVLGHVPIAAQGDTAAMALEYVQIAVVENTAVLVLKVVHFVVPENIAPLVLEHVPFVGLENGVSWMEWHRANHAWQGNI